MFVTEFCHAKKLTLLTFIDALWMIKETKTVVVDKFSPMCLISYFAGDPAQLSVHEMESPSVMLL